MRHLAISGLLLTLAVAFAAAKDETMAEMKARLDHAPPEDRPGICILIAEHQLRDADKLYTDGQVEQAQAEVEDVVTYSEKARDSAYKANRHLKSVEITVRKMAEKLRDIKRTLAFDDQPPVDQAIKRLEDIRTALLKEMFKKDKK